MSIDALPYYDTEPTEEERDAADLLVEHELPSFRPLHPAIKDSSEWQPKSLLMRQELLRCEQRGDMNAVDLTRYEDVELPVTRELEAFRDVLKRNIVVSDSMSARQENLAMLKSLGPNAWTLHVFQLEYMLKQLETELLTVRRQTELVNVERKKVQTVAGERLSALDDRWRALISSNLELSVANAVLEQEIQDLS